MSRPCKRGHTGGRYKSGACIECMLLRKGKAGRKVPKSAGDRIVIAAKKLGKKTLEVIRAERQEARTRRANAKLERDMAARIELDWLKAGDHVNAQKRAAKANPGLTIKVASTPRHEPPVAPEYLTRTVGDGEKGSRVEYVRDRDGQPIPLNRPAVAPAPAAPAPEKPTKTPVTFKGRLRAGTHDCPGMLPPWVKRVSNGTVVARQPTRKELAARHTSLAGGSGVRGFDDAGGIPSYNASHQVAAEGDRAGWRQGGAYWTKKL